MIRVHTANQRDINGMFEIDLRAYDYPLSYLDFKDMLMSKDHFCVISADDSHNVTGFAVFKKHAATGYLEIIRLGVTPKRRHEGIGKALVQAGDDFASDHRLHEMFVVVPETKCVPGDPDDVSRWLKWSGFKAVTPLLRDAFTMYGSPIDGVKFVRPVHVA